MSSMKAGPIEEVDEATRDAGPEEWKNIRGFSVADLILRGFAAIGTFGSAIAMATTNETTLAFPTQFIFRAKYNDLPMFTFFVIANSIVCGYLVLSLPLSVFHFIRNEAKTTRIVLLIFDTVMLVLLTAGASVATAIVSLAHKGNASVNWAPICRQFDNFCERSSGSLIGSFISIIMMSLIIIASSVANLRRS